MGLCIYGLPPAVFAIGFKKKTSEEVFHTACAFGGPTYTFLKPQPSDNVIEDLTLLYTRLVDLGMEHRDGKVYLADLEERDV